MTQQPYPGGYPQQGYPPQGPPQGYPPSQQAPQQQGPPSWAGQQQAQPQQGWGQQQAPQQGPIASAVDPTAASAAFFGGQGGGGDGVPSFKWGGKGTGVQGLVKDAQIVENIDFTTKQPIIDEKDQQPAKQLRIELETNLRNWEHVSKIPLDDTTGQPKAPHEDNGLRAIYTGGKRSNGQSWMSGAIQDAMRAAGRDPALGLEIGSLLGVMVEGEYDSGRGNPYRKYVAKYAPVGTHQGLPAPQAQQQQGGYQQQGPPQGYQQPQQAPQGAPQGPPPQQGGDPWATYQPQAPGQGLPQPPQGPPAGWGNAPTYDEPPFSGGF